MKNMLAVHKNHKLSFLLLLSILSVYPSLAQPSYVNETGPQNSNSYTNNNYSDKRTYINTSPYDINSNNQNPNYGRIQNISTNKTLNPQQAAKIYQWFLQYDDIRRQAQMNPIEKQQADSLLSRGLALFIPGQEKYAARQLLTGLVNRYTIAVQSMQNLTPIPETKQLQDMYLQYFQSALALFSDYLRVQDNVFAVDSTGQSIAKQLLQRKLALENLEHNCKNLDSQVRFNFKIAEYQY